MRYMTNDEFKRRAALMKMLNELWEPVLADPRDFDTETDRMWEVVVQRFPMFAMTLERFRMLDQVSTGSDWQSKMVLRTATSLIGFPE